MNKKGFFAISLIYSFFIVFLALMAAMLAQSVRSRVLVGRVKEDIRSDLDSSRGLYVNGLSEGYMVGDTVFLAGEEWRVLSDNTTSYALILNRALTKTELIQSTGISLSNSRHAEYYGTCSAENSCQLRACLNTPSNIEFCYLYTAGGVTYENFHRKPTWKMNLSSGELGQNFGTTIVSKAVNVWFNNHQGLQRLKNARKLVGKENPPYLNDGTTLSNNHSITGYVRIPSIEEINNLPILSKNNLKGITPLHVMDLPAGEVRINIFNNTGAITSVYSNTAAYVRPVIEVLKD